MPKPYFKKEQRLTSDLLSLSSQRRQQLSPVKKNKNSNVVNSSSSLLSWQLPSCRRRIFMMTVMAMAGFFVLANIFFDSGTSTVTVVRRNLCVSGSLKSMLSARMGTTATSRLLSLCEVETSLAGGSFGSAFGETEPVGGGAGYGGNYTGGTNNNNSTGGSTVNNYTDFDPDGQAPGGENDVAFVVTIPSCPEDASTTANSSNVDPGDNFYDAAAVLRDSVCNCTSDNPESGSNYSNTMYAVIHPDALECLSPVSGDTTGEGGSSSSQERRSLGTLTTTSGQTYNRVAVLEELGYFVKILGVPEVGGGATNIENIRDLMSLYAYKLDNHPVSVMINFGTVFTSPIDAFVDELKTDSTKKAKFSRRKDGKVNPGIVFIKPDTEEFDRVIELVQSYDENSGWNGTGVTGSSIDLESLLTFHFDQNAEAYDDATEALADNVVNFGTNDDCGEPWDCKYEEDWDAETQQQCTELNQVWYRQRKSFETRWNKPEKVDTTQSTYHTDAFLGYCAENGSYQRAADFSVSKRYDCPTVPGGAIVLGDFNPQLNAVDLPMTADTDSGQLCILSIQSQSKMIPVARSYNGREWEASGGFLASRLTAPTCDSDTGRCTFARNGLPPPEFGESYILTYYEHAGSGGDNADAARFLEQSTFGGSLTDITNLVNTGLNYESWLTEQMSPSIMTSHREYYRRRLNKESEYSSSDFAGPGPSKACDANSQWRTYALSEIDGINSATTDVSKYLSFRELNGVGTGGPYLWLVEGMVRTVTNELPSLKEWPSGNVIATTMEVEPTMYEIVFGMSNSYRWNCVGCPVRVLTHTAAGAHGAQAYVDNPRVSLTTNTTNIESLAHYSIVTLPNTGEGLTPINNGDDFRNNPIGGAENWFAQFNAAGEEFVLTTQAQSTSTSNNSTSTNACLDHPTTASAAFTHVTQLDSTINSGVGAARHVRSAFPPIFGKTFHAATQQDEYLLFSPKLYVPENTPENPLPDGGKVLRDLSADDEATVDTTYARTKCSNAPRNFLNEQHCRLSTTVSDACSANQQEADGPGVVVCGSVGEVSNSADDAAFGGRNHAFSSISEIGTGFDRNTGTSSDPFIPYKNTIWANIALMGPDQLRQRVAWALYQIIPIGSELTTETLETAQYVEGWTQYYDIFVRNAFGNFRDVLKQIAYNPAMARWLSFKDNKSLQYDLDNGGPGAYPDENFAREIMQLFSIGIYQLGTNGAIELDRDTGAPLMSYDTADLMSFSRVWTGLTPNAVRGNAHGTEDISVDPLAINPEYRDVFPKSDLEGGYLGDGYPLCADLPDRMQFRKGAVYRLLGSRGSPELQKEGSSTADALLQMVLDSTSSPLYNALCQPDTNNGGVCTFPGYVELTQNLDYSSSSNTAASSLPEFVAVETLRTVQVQSTPIPIYYEYVQPPCVETHFFNGGKKVIAGLNADDSDVFMCANPILSGVAAPGCCSTTASTTADTTALGSNCVYYGERLSYQATVDRCSGASSSICTNPQSIRWETPYATADCSTPSDVQGKTWYSWTATDCQTKVKLSYREGVEASQVARVDDDTTTATGVSTGYYTNSSSLVRSDTMNFYKVHWMGQSETAPNTTTACDAISTCTSTVDGCICDVNINDHALYYSSVDQIVSTESLLASVFLGAVDADVYDAGLYTSIGDCNKIGILDDVAVLTSTLSTTTTTSCTSLDVNTIFTVTDNFGVTHRRKNVQSTVEILNTGLSFRNPVHMISMLDRDERDMHYEVDALLDHLFYYKSHAPFLALRMIQRFGISNPSPGLMTRVTTAYTTGMYGNFGSGKYGDLAAFMACLLLDTESRSTVLDADPSHGQIREPMLKVTSYIRSMEGRYKIPLNWAKFYDMDIGQDSYGTDSVFSFFLPENEPAGIIGDSGLVSPEAGALSGSLISNLLEGLLALSKFGLTNCNKGIVSNYAYNGCDTVEGNYGKSEGQLEFTPSNIQNIDTMLDEFSLLLTAGRLGAANRAIIKSVVNDVHQYGHYNKAVRIAQQLIAMTPEYHATNLVRRESVEARSMTGNEGNYDETDYKAVVYWLFKGGMDSFNLIVPLDHCENGKDMFAEYTRARNYVALSKDQLLNISAVGSNQVCDTFGINKNFPILHELYQANDALFIANMGVLTQPIDKHMDWQSTLPILFAHNHMQKEAQTIDPLKRNPGTGVGGRLMDMLKKNGYKTAANTVRGRSTLNKGDPKYGNPSWSISSAPFADFDPKSTIGEEVISIVKELNGVTDSDTSIYGETWSQGVHQMLFEHEEEKRIATALATANLDMTNYGATNSRVAGYLKAVAKTMKSRHLRKVNRDIYYLHQRSPRNFDDHFRDNLAANLQLSNAAMTQFVNWVKAEGLWQSTVIVMASDFGRTVIPNPRGGTDHAWGGNYFMAGGGIKGGQILGEYPKQLSRLNKYWTGNRGRMIPSTPYDAQWNAIATWMGVKGDTDLNFVLPTRPNFPKCSLFTDEDVFDNFNVPRASCEIDDLDGDGIADADDYCEKTKYWVDGNAVDTYGCPEPTPVPAPTTSAPTVTRSAIPVANVLDKGSKVVALGAYRYFSKWSLLDGKTGRFQITKASNWGPPGFIATPSHGMSSIVHGFRIYSADSSPNWFPMTFVLQGRNNRAQPWQQLAEGNLNTGTARNVRGITINSTPYAPDTSLAHREVLFDNILSYKQYRVVFPQTRDPNNLQCAVGNVELVGRLIPDGWTPPPSQSPTTASPTTPQPTEPPTSAAPSVSLVPSSMPSIRCSTVNWPEGGEKIILNQNYDWGVTGKMQWGSVVKAWSPGYNDAGEAAEMSYTYKPGREAAIRQMVGYRNECIRGGMRLRITWDVKLLNYTDNTGLPCTAGSSCPSGRIRARQNNPAGGTYCNSWYYLSRTETDWTVGEWNQKSVDFTIPSSCIGSYWNYFYLDLTMGKWWEPLAAKMIVDNTVVQILDD